MSYAENISELIGNTPLVKLQEASEASNCLVLGKCEFMNPNGSVKDRIGLNMIDVALNSERIDKDTVLIEPTSGNTGIALASICAAYGMRLILTMPSSMSVERRKLLEQLGAELVLTDPKDGMKGAIDKANEIRNTIPASYILSQFANPANPKIHESTTAIEILDALEGKIDLFVAGVGTGGTITGTGKVLKSFADATIIAVEPKDSAVLSGEPAAPHKIQGIGAGFIPEVVDIALIDDVIKVAYEDALKRSRALAKNEGLLVGISSGANIEAAVAYAQKHALKDKVIVTVLCDTAERYLSTDLFL
jgi:cysteine synthase A